MANWTLKQIADITGGQVQGDGNVRVTQPVCDSRQPLVGRIFVPVKGARVDGHEFLAEVTAKGAAASFCRTDYPLADIPPDLPVILVEDPVAALQVWARYHLARLNVPVIGITGSTGKTTTKELTAAVLRPHFTVGKTEGNLNTEIGLPVSILQTEPGVQVLVLEMGMRGLGEIRELTEMAPPDVAIITNVGETHIELLGSKENIALAKGEILEGMKPSGAAVLNGDDPLVRKQAERTSARKLWFSLVGGQAPSHTLQAASVEGVFEDQFGYHFIASYEGEESRVFLPGPGIHNVSNALAAIGAGLALGLTLAQATEGLRDFRPAANRLNILKCDSGLTIIDDTYNASPASVQAALQVLAEYPAKGRRVVVLADMLELGEIASEAHRTVGEQVARLRFDSLFTIGSWSQLIRQAAREEGLSPEFCQHAESKAELFRLLCDYLQPSDTVLIKGSRGMQMETIVKSLREEGAAK